MENQILLNLILILSLISTANAFFNYFISFLHEEGNLLDWYWNWIQRFNKNKHLYKFLGGCIVCHTTWISIGIWILIANLFNLYIPAGILYVGATAGKTLFLIRLQERLYKE